MANAGEQTHRKRCAWLLLSVVGLLCASPSHSASLDTSILATTTSAEDTEHTVCNSLTGPFCLPLGASSQYASYMIPITTESLYQRNQPSIRDSPDLVAGAATKQCFFQHFARSWMDSNGDENDLMNAQVKTVDECEKLCCDHPECKSFTMWMGTTCFLRALPGTPRSDGNSFSGNRLT